MAPRVRERFLRRGFNYIAWVVDYLCASMPEFIANMERFMVRPS